MTMQRSNFCQNPIFLVCMDVHVQTKRKSDFGSGTEWNLRRGAMDISWSFGTCSATPTYRMDSRGDKKYSRLYLERCCLSPGFHTLICSNTRPEGWNGGVLEVRGHPHCNDFIGYTAMTQLYVKGIKSHTLDIVSFVLILYNLYTNLRSRTINFLADSHALIRHTTNLFQLVNRFDASVGGLRVRNHWDGERIGMPIAKH